jgi:hypothetical protein
VLGRVQMYGNRSVNRDLRTNSTILHQGAVRCRRAFMSRFKSIAFYPTAVIGVLLALIGLFFVIEQRRTQAETSAVLSAFFSQAVLNDMDKSDAKHALTIVVMRHPDCEMCSVEGGEFDRQFWFGRSLKSRASLLTEAWFAQSSRTTRASFFVNSVLSTDVSADLNLPKEARAVFVSPSDLGTKPGDFEARFPNNFGHFVVSHVGLNLNKTEALVYVDHFCGGLCGGGGYILMRKVEGVWHIVDRNVTWVS